METLYPSRARLDVHMNIIGTIENGWIVIIKRYGEDARGKLRSRLPLPTGLGTPKIPKSGHGPDIKRTKNAS